MAAGTIVKTAEDAIAVAFQIVEAAKNEIVWLIPPSLLSLSSTYDISDKVKAFIQNGGVLRGITIISRANVEETRLRLGIGEDVRHAGYYQELFMLIGDKQYSISAINTGTQEYTQDTHIVAFWSDDSVYAEYLLSSFEIAWSQSIPAEERIQELLREDAPGA